jgi:hypothetical protein
MGPAKVRQPKANKVVINSETSEQLKASEIVPYERTADRLMHSETASLLVTTATVIEDAVAVLETCLPPPRAARIDSRSSPQPWPAAAWRGWRSG